MMNALVRESQNALDYVCARGDVFDRRIMHRDKTYFLSTPIKRGSFLIYLLHGKTLSSDAENYLEM